MQPKSYGPSTFRMMEFKGLQLLYCPGLSQFEVGDAKQFSKQFNEQFKEQCNKQCKKQFREQYNEQFREQFSKLFSNQSSKLEPS